jgi:hypothetical protein
MRPATIDGMAHDEPQLLPLVSDCGLDTDALGVQGARYASLGRELVEVERSRGRLIASFTANVDADLVRETIEVERECCPFFTLAYDDADHRLSITVQDPSQNAALDALQYSLNANR